MLNDRRRIPRVPVYFMLEHLSRASGAGSEEGNGAVKNITPAGLLLETTAPLKKKDLLQLSFTLPHVQRTLNLETRVRWVNRKTGTHSAGLEFMDLSAEDREAIMEYLMSLGPNV
jgi:hypothetical protein